MSKISMMAPKATPPKVGPCPARQSPWASEPPASIAHPDPVGERDGAHFWAISWHIYAPAFAYSGKCAGEFTRKYSMWSRFVQCTGLQRVAARPVRLPAPRDRLPRVLGPGLRGCGACPGFRLPRAHFAGPAPRSPGVRSGSVRSGVSGFSDMAISLS